jgi:hypothetical protein
MTLVNVTVTRICNSIKYVCHYAAEYLTIPKWFGNHSLKTTRIRAATIVEEMNTGNSFSWVYVAGSWSYTSTPSYTLIA